MMIWNTQKAKDARLLHEVELAFEQAEDILKRHDPYYAPARAEAEEALEVIFQKGDASGFSEEELRALSQRDAKETVLAQATQRLQREYENNFCDDWDATAIVKSCMRAQLQEMQEEMARE